MICLLMSDCGDLYEEEEKMSLVQTAMSAGETTPPTSQRILTDNVSSEQEKLISSPTDTKILDRWESIWQNILMHEFSLYMTVDHYVSDMKVWLGCSDGVPCELLCSCNWEVRSGCSLIAIWIWGNLLVACEKTVPAIPFLTNVNVQTYVSIWWLMNLMKVPYIYHVI